MKRFLSLLLCISMLLSSLPVLAGASAGQVIGDIYSTNIMASVNDLYIPSYSFDGKTAILIKDLDRYGFDVWYDEASKTAFAFFDKDKTPAPYDVVRGTEGTWIAHQLSTDIRTVINGVQVPSCNVGGNMAVCIEEICDTYNSANYSHDQSPYNVDYMWDGLDRVIHMHVADNTISYQDFILRLLKAAKLMPDDPFYQDFIAPKRYDSYEKFFNANNDFINLFTDTLGGALDPHMELLVASGLIRPSDYTDYQLKPYRSATKTDAILLLNRVLGYISWSSTPKSKYTDLTNDWWKVPDWLKNYVGNLMDLDVLHTDAQNEIGLNEFLTAERADEMIADCMNYMTRGIDAEIQVQLKLVNEFLPVKLSVPAQIIDGVIYIPGACLYNTDKTKINSLSTLEIFGQSYMYYMVNSKQACTNYFRDNFVPFVPAISLYGYLMLPTYDFNIGTGGFGFGQSINYDEDNKVLTISLHSPPMPNP